MERSERDRLDEQILAYIAEHPHCEVSDINHTIRRDLTHSYGEDSIRSALLRLQRQEKVRACLHVRGYHRWKHWSLFGVLPPHPLNNDPLSWSPKENWVNDYSALRRKRKRHTD